jgi:hypothetical protein
LNHFTVPCAILTFLVVDAAPAMARGPRATIAFGQPVTERAGGVDRAAGQLPGGWNFPARPATAAGANTRADGACRRKHLVLNTRPTAEHEGLTVWRRHG